MAPFTPSTRPTRLRRLVARGRSAAVVVIATALASVLCGAAPLSARGPSPADGDGRTVELDWIAQLPTDTGSDEGDVNAADTLNATAQPTQQQPAQPATPDTTAAATQAQPSSHPDTTSTVPSIQAISVPDTLRSAPADTLHSSTLSTTPDSANAALRTPAQSAAPDTIFPTTTGQVLPIGPRVPATVRPQTPQGPKQEPPKPRTGIFGIHPIAILVGLAALHYAVIHLVE